MVNDLFLFVPTVIETMNFGVAKKRAQRRCAPTVLEYRLSILARFLGIQIPHEVKDLDYINS